MLSNFIISFLISCVLLDHKYRYGAIYCDILYKPFLINTECQCLIKELNDMDVVCKCVRERRF